MGCLLTIIGLPIIIFLGIIFNLAGIYGGTNKRR